MEVVATQRDHSSAVTHVCFSPDGSLTASCSRDRKVLVFSVASGHQVRSCQRQRHIHLRGACAAG